MEMTGAGRQPWPYLPQAYDFHNGKLWPNDRPGLGVTLDTSKLQHGGRLDRALRRRSRSISRPDGSYTNW